MKKGKQRTLSQNKALHLYFTMLADELNAAGYDMKKILKPEIDIPWTADSIKNFVWRPIQRVMLEKESTKDLNRVEITKVWEVIHKSIGEKYGISVFSHQKNSYI